MAFRRDGLALLFEYFLLLLCTTYCNFFLTFGNTMSEALGIGM